MDSCGNCKFFRGRMDSVGTCHKKGPLGVMIAPGQTQGFWPPTPATEWCGDYEIGIVLPPATGLSLPIK